MQRKMTSSQEGFVLTGFFSNEERKIFKDNGFQVFRSHILLPFGAVIPSRLMHIERLLELFAFEFDRFFLRKIANSNNSRITESNAKETQKIYNPKLWGYQNHGVDFLLRHNGAILGDEMGLGKTIQIIETVNQLRQFPILIVCPATLRMNWEIEFNKWIPGIQTHQIKGRKNYALPPAHVYVITYDIVAAWAVVIASSIFKMMVFDESHYIKNRTSKRSKAATFIAKRCERVYCVTGTPITNSPVDLVPQLDTIKMINQFGGKSHFETRYCAAHKTKVKDRQIYDVSGAANLEELNERLRSLCYLRRLKADVLEDLPDKIISRIDTRLSNQEEYQQILDDLVSYVREEHLKNPKAFGSFAEKLTEAENKARIAAMNETLVRIIKMRKAISFGKRQAALDKIQEHIENDQKVVVFCCFRDTADFLAAHFNAPKIVGGISPENKQKAIEDFQKNKETKVIVLNIKSGAEGVTLTAASHLIFVDLDWTPAAHRQAEDRIHRIGQKNAANIYYLLAEGTYDEDIFDLLKSKGEVVDTVTDGSSIRHKFLEKILQA